MSYELTVSVSELPDEGNDSLCFRGINVAWFRVCLKSTAGNRDNPLDLKWFVFWFGRWNYGLS